MAGIFLLNYLKIDEKPKFLFSGSDKTLDLINYFQLLNMRLLDVSIVSVLPSSEGIDYPIMENRIDEYLLKRQVEVCQNQSLEKLIELKSIVEQWTEEKCPRCDEELIPDVSNKSKVEYWSLITLFPKQVLSIKSSKNFEENQRYLLEILRSDFRFLIWWVLSNHVNPLSYETDSDKVRNFKNRLMVLKHLDFSNLEEINEKASNYKGISSFEYFNDRKENGISMVDHTDVPKNTQIHKLRDKVVEVYKSSIKHHKPYIINEVVLGKNTEKFTEICRSSASEMWKEECPITGGDIVKMWAKWYGIYALDVLFIFEIAMLNKKGVRQKIVILVWHIILNV